MSLTPSCPVSRFYQLVPLLPSLPLPNTSLPKGDRRPPRPRQPPATVPLGVSVPVVPPRAPSPAAARPPRASGPRPSPRSGTAPRRRRGSGLAAGGHLGRGGQRPRSPGRARAAAARSARAQSRSSPGASRRPGRQRALAAPPRRFLRAPPKPARSRPPRAARRAGEPALGRTCDAGRPVPAASSRHARSDPGPRRAGSASSRVALRPQRRTRRLPAGGARPLPHAAPRPGRSRRHRGDGPAGAQEVRHRGRGDGQGCLASAAAPPGRRGRAALPPPGDLRPGAAEGRRPRAREADGDAERRPRGEGRRKVGSAARRERGRGAGRGLRPRAAGDAPRAHRLGSRCLVGGTLFIAGEGGTQSVRAECAGPAPWVREAPARPARAARGGACGRDAGIFTEGAKNDRGWPHLRSGQV